MYSPYDFTHSIPQLLSEATIQREQLAAQKASAKPASGASKSSSKAASGSTQAGATPLSPTPSKATTTRGTPGTAGRLASSAATSSDGRQRGRGGNDIVVLQHASAQQASSSKPGTGTAQDPALWSPGSSRQVQRDRPLARGGKTRKTLPVKSEHVHGPNGRVLATGQERQIQPAQPTVIPFVKAEDYKELGPEAALDWLRAAAAAPQQVGPWPAADL